MSKKQFQTPRMILLSAVTIMFVALTVPTAARGALSFTIGGSWDTESRRNAATAAMQAVVDRFNAYGNFGNYNIWVYYDAGIPTAQASYLGSIGFGGTWPNERVTEHEACHYLGTGTTSGWSGLMVGGQWQGIKTNSLMQQFDGIGSVLYGDSIHFWPYGLNYDTEGSEIEKARCAALLYAMRIDMGLGSTAPPSTATTVTLTASDALGTSGFNYSNGWSDAHFAHSGANYYTGNYAIRTPASSNSFNFVGDSLTLNNTGDSSKGLFFKGSGTTGVQTFKNLILDGGSIHHYSSASDLFQLAGKITVASASTINSEQGSTNILAKVTGSGPLTIGTTSGNYVRLLSSSNTFTGNINVVGRFELANGANQKFVIGASGVNNAITGASANQVLLNGIFDLNLTDAGANPGDSWTLATAANRTYGTTFGVNGFIENPAGLWNNYAGYAFSESTSMLTVVPLPATAAWSGASSANWSGSANWNAAQPANSDKLTFAAAGPSGTTLTDNLMTPGTYNVSDITFTSAAPAYTINPGTAGTNGFTLAGEITNSSTNQQTINDAISLPHGAPNTRTFTTTAGGGNITIGGNVSGQGGVAKAGAGTLTLSGNNTYTGGTRVDSGILLLTGTLNPSSALSVGGGTFTYANPAAAMQTTAGLTVDTGASMINNTSSGTLALGTITRKTGGTVDFATMIGAVTTTAANTNGIIGPWAFVGTGTSTLYAYSNGGVIAAYTGATVESGTGSFGGIPGGNTSTVNYNVTSSGSFASMGIWRNVNTIDYSGSGAATQPAANNTWLIINGLMNTGTGPLTIGSSSPRIDIVIGSNRDLVVAAMTSNIVINNIISDHYTGESALTKIGSGTLILNGANTYTGTTTIGGGTLQIGSGSAGASLASSAINNFGALVFHHSSTLTYAGDISGTGTMTKLGAGALTLRGINSYTGSTNINQGQLIIDSGDLADVSTVNVANGALLQVISGTPTLGDVAGLGSTSVSGAGTVLTVDNIVQNTLTIGAGAKLVIAPITGGPLYANDIHAVPEPSTIVMLLIALAAATTIRKSPF
jgi:autotransporter-associated beta strand protein